MVAVKGPKPRAQTHAVTSPKSTKRATPAPATRPAPAAGWAPKTARAAGPTAVAPKTIPEIAPPAVGGAAPAQQVAIGPTKPRNIDEAFDAISATASAPAEVRRHVDNVMAWNMKWDLVTKAEKTFDFSYFSVERDAYGTAYLGALLQQQMKGVQVTGIVDYMANSRGHGFVSTGLGADYMQELVAAGAKIGVYDGV